MVLVLAGCAWAGEWYAPLGQWRFGQQIEQLDYAAGAVAFDLTGARRLPRAYVEFNVAPVGTGVRAVQLVVAAKSDVDYYFAHFDARNSQVILVHRTPQRQWVELKRRRKVLIECGKWHTAALLAFKGRLVAYLDGKRILQAPLPGLELAGYCGLGTSQGRARFRHFNTFGEAMKMTFEHKLTQRVTVCHDGGAGDYEAFPDVVRLDNGELLCVFYAGYAHVSKPAPQLPNGGRVCAVRSKDNGLTWSNATIVYDDKYDNRDPHIAQLADGTVLCTFFSLDFDETGNYLRKGIYLVRSEDNGHTWSEPLCIKPNFVGSAPVRQLPDGSLIITLYTGDHGHFRTAVTRSFDGGFTWDEPVFLTTEADGSNDEADVVLLKSGKLLAAIRPTMNYTTSDDLGKTWTPVKPMGFEGHAPYFLYTSNGVLLLAHRLPNTALHYSLDDGQTWQGPVVVDNVIGAYPSMQELPDGTVIIVYYQEGEGSDIFAKFFKADQSGITFLEPADLSTGK